MSEVEEACWTMEQQKREERAEARRQRYAAGVARAPAAPTRDALSSQPDPHTQVASSRVRGAKTSAAADADFEALVAELSGQWLLDTGTAAFITAADFGVGARLTLGGDGSCSFAVDCWNDDDAEQARRRRWGLDESRACLRCDGVWSVQAIGRPCGCVPPSCAHLVVRMDLHAGDEVGPAVAELPLRWAQMPEHLMGVLHAEQHDPAGRKVADDDAQGNADATSAAEGSSALGGPRLHLRIAIRDREWHFSRARASPMWVDRCALAGLAAAPPPESSAATKPSALLTTFTTAGRQRAMGGGSGCSEYLHEAWFGFWLALASCMPPVLYTDRSRAQERKEQA